VKSLLEHNLERRKRICELYNIPFNETINTAIRKGRREFLKKQYEITRKRTIKQLDDYTV
jgi:hypothetical protein